MINVVIKICGIIFLLSILMVNSSADIYDIKVNDDNSLKDQYNPRIAVSKNGNFAVVWTDKRYDQIDIFFQLFDSAGVPLSSNKKLNDITVGIPQFEPAIDANYTSQYLAVWRDYRNGTYPLNPDLFFSRIDTTQTPENINVTSQISDVILESPDIAMFPDGAAVVVWSDYRNNQWDIYGQLLDSDGNLTGANFKINSEAGNAQQHSPRAAAFNSGGFVVTWYDNRLGHDDIFFQRYDTDAQSIGLNIKANDDVGVTKQAFPAIGTDGTKRFVLAWVDWRNGDYPDNPDIYYRRYDSSGTAAGTSVKINSNDAGRSQKEVSIACDRLGNFCLVWSDSAAGTWDARAQIIDYTGSKVGDNFDLHESTTGKQLQPDVAADGYKFYFTWADYRDGNFDIYATIKKYNEISLLTSPNKLEFFMPIGGSLPDTQEVSVSNAGIGEISWQAYSQVDWLSISSASGQTPGSFYVRVNTDTLDYGSHYGDIVLVNLTNGDSTASLPVHFFVASADTIQFITGNAMPNSIGMIPLVFNLDGTSRGGYIPLMYDTTSAQLDSIVITQGQMPDFVEYSSLVIPGGIGEFGFRINETYFNDSLIPAGNYHLASLFFTTGEDDAHCLIDSSHSDSSGSYIINMLGDKETPSVIPGELIIGSPTAVDDEDYLVLPNQYELNQNYPNPFNSQTNIAFSIPSAMNVTLEIYNILGQRVSTLFDNFLTSGEHTFAWAGLLEDGRSAPSGVYFYKFETDNFRDIKKMVLLK